MKYDTQIGELKNKLDTANSILVVLPRKVNVDKLAAALSLYLSLKQSGKTVAVVTESELRVSQAALFGIGDIKNKLPESNTGNFIMKLDGVVEGGKVPALVNLDWYPTGNDLNLVFHVAPGKKFEPINISHHYDSTNFQLIFFLGAPILGDFGNIYTNNIAQLGDATKVNIDISQNNSLFGQINITDPNTSSLSEVVAQILQGLNLPQDTDIASNIITGIYDKTNNLTSRVSADTFITVGQEMQLGGKVPFIQAQLNQGGLDISKFSKQGSSSDGSRQSSDNTNQPGRDSGGQQVSGSTQPVSQPQNQSTDTPIPVETPIVEGETIEEPLPSTEQADTSSQADSDGYAKSQFEVPAGEQVTSGSTENPNPAPDWLTPKIFKGGGMG